MKTCRKSLGCGVFGFHSQQELPWSTNCQKGLGIAAFGMVSVILLALFEALNIPEVALGFIGALAYYSLPLFRMVTKRLSAPSCTKAPSAQNGQPWAAADKGAASTSSGCAAFPPSRGTTPTHSPSAASPQQPPRQHPHTHPPVAPVSQLPPPPPNSAWSAHIRAILAELTPSAKTMEAVLHIARFVESCLQPHFPEAFAAGFAVGNPKPGQHFAAVMPEVKIVVSIGIDALVKRLDVPWARYGRLSRSCTRKVHKMALRIFSEMLVKASFKFKRFALAADDPKIILMAPAAISGAAGMPIELMINAMFPLSLEELMHRLGRAVDKIRQVLHVVRPEVLQDGFSNLPDDGAEGPLFENHPNGAVGHQRGHRCIDTNQSDDQRYDASKCDGADGQDHLDTTAMDLAALATPAGVASMLAELKRADRLSVAEASLSELLEPWLDFSVASRRPSENTCRPTRSGTMSSTSSLSDAHGEDIFSAPWE